jgi:Zn-finger nucleic acid-binding protein
MMYTLSEHACPRCRDRLYVGHASGVTLHGCAHCGGVWLGSACAMRVAEALPEDAIALAGRVSKSAKRGAETHAPVACPICSAPMTRTHAAAAGVDLDVCGAHGTWYDKDELEQIAKALSSSAWRSGPNGKRRGGTAAVAGAAAGAALAAGAVAGAAPAGSNTSTLETAAEVGAEIVVEGAAEVVLEGAFSVVGAILGAIFD